MKTTITDFEMPSMMMLLNSAKKDPDAASVVVLGKDLEEAVGCVIVVKGSGNTRRVLEHLEALGMMTPGQSFLSSLP